LEYLECYSCPNLLIRRGDTFVENMMGARDLLGDLIGDLLGEPRLRGEPRDNTIETYRLQWDAFHDAREEQERRVRAQERCWAVKEELMATALHPQRIERWLEAGGWDLVDALM
jgi:hypothetical protein